MSDGSSFFSFLMDPIVQGTIIFAVAGLVFVWWMAVRLKEKQSKSIDWNTQPELLVSNIKVEYARIGFFDYWDGTAEIRGIEHKFRVHRKLVEERPQLKGKIKDKRPSGVVSELDYRMALFSIFSHLERKYPDLFSQERSK